jgi:hypothetical protein
MHNAFQRNDSTIASAMSADDSGPVNGGNGGNVEPYTIL